MESTRLATSLVNAMRVCSLYYSIARESLHPRASTFRFRNSTHRGGETRTPTPALSPAVGLCGDALLTGPSLPLMVIEIDQRVWCLFSPSF
jgi:hypothetical protein